MNAFSFGFSLSICVRWASITSAGEISCFRIFSAIETAGRKVRSFMKIFLATDDRAFVSRPESERGTRPWQDRPVAADQSLRGVAARHPLPCLLSCDGSADSFPHPE